MQKPTQVTRKPEIRRIDITGRGPPPLRAPHCRRPWRQVHLLPLAAALGNAQTGPGIVPRLIWQPALHRQPRSNNMITTSHSSDKIPQPIPTETDPQDAITLLTEDHEHVKSLFEQYEELGDRAHATKQKLAVQICTELTKHATAEEE